MRDPDEVMAYEAKQQDLVDDIVRSLHNAAGEIEDSDYLVVFRPLAKDLLEELCGRYGTTYVPHGRAGMIPRLVNGPIIAFIGGDKLPERHAEFRYLQLKVFEKVSAAIASRIVQEYHRLALGF